jgi:hypothetical protein
MKLNYNGKVTGNGLHIYKRKDFDRDVLHFLNKDVTVTIQKRRKKRSLDQNSYYWGVVVPMIREGLLDVGYKVSMEQTHDFLKDNFNQGELVNEKTGDILKTTKSTSGLTTSEFMEYIEDISRWATEYLSLVLPMPGEQVTIELGNN